jgi:hypothetical protein
MFSACTAHCETNQNAPQLSFLRNEILLSLLLFIVYIATLHHANTRCYTSSRHLSQCNIPRSTVIRLIQRHETTKSLHASRKGRCSRHNILSRRTSRHLAMKSRMNPSASSRAVAAAVGCDALC